jgi:hypothetical protein
MLITAAESLLNLYLPHPNQSSQGRLGDLHRGFTSKLSVHIELTNRDPFSIRYLTLDSLILMDTSVVGWAAESAAHEDRLESAKSAAFGTAYPRLLT